MAPLRDAAHRRRGVGELTDGLGHPARRHRGQARVTRGRALAWRGRAAGGLLVAEQHVRHAPRMPALGRDDRGEERHDRGADRRGEVGRARCCRRRRRPRRAAPRPARPGRCGRRGRRHRERRCTAAASRSPGPPVTTTGHPSPTSAVTTARACAGSSDRAGTEADGWTTTYGVVGRPAGAPGSGVAQTQAAVVAGCEDGGPRPRRGRGRRPPRGRRPGHRRRRHRRPSAGRGRPAASRGSPHWSRRRGAPGRGGTAAPSAARSGGTR